MLSEGVRPFCGVELKNVRNEEEQEKPRPGGWEIWERKIMGLTDLPYHVCQAVMWDRGVALGEFWVGDSDN